MFELTCRFPALRAKHALEPGSAWGVNGDTGDLADMNTFGIWEPAAVKLQTVKTAVESACMLLRIDGVQQVRESKYIMLHAPRSALPAIRLLLPGSESPTIIPLEGHPDRVAVHAVCRENVFWETLEQLKSAGASALLVLPVEKMLA